MRLNVYFILKITVHPNAYLFVWINFSWFIFKKFQKLIFGGARQTVARTINRPVICLLHRQPVEPSVSCSAPTDNWTVPADDRSAPMGDRTLTVFFTSFAGRPFSFHNR